LRHLGGCGSSRDDHVDPETYQLGSRILEPVDTSRSKAALDDDVLPFDPAQFDQAFQEGIVGRHGRSQREIAYARGPGRALRDRDKRPSERAARKANESAAVHSSPGLKDYAEFYSRSSGVAMPCRGPQGADNRHICLTRERSATHDACLLHSPEEEPAMPIA